MKQLILTYCLKWLPVTLPCLLVLTFLLLFFILGLAVLGLAVFFMWKFFELFLFVLEEITGYNKRQEAIEAVKPIKKKSNKISQLFKLPI